MSEKACSCGCASERAAQFTELAPTLEQYAKVPGSLITILQKTQEIRKPGIPPASETALRRPREVLLPLRQFPE